MRAPNWWHATTGLAPAPAMIDCGATTDTAGAQNRLKKRLWASASRFAQANQKAQLIQTENSGLHHNFSARLFDLL
jgi:hypothetical protein